MKLLLIEPDKILGQILQANLQTAGHTVLWCRTAQKSLDALDEELPDLIILEIQLGLHNGIEFLYEIRSYPEWQHIPVAVHTINTKALDMIFGQAFEQLGVRSVLYKPRTTTKQLLRLVDQFVPAI